MVQRQVLKWGQQMREPVLVIVIVVVIIALGWLTVDAISHLPG
jgi:hypothetical protein